MLMEKTRGVLVRSALRTNSKLWVKEPRCSVLVTLRTK